VIVGGLSETLGEWSSIAMGHGWKDLEIVRLNDRKCNDLEYIVTIDVSNDPKSHVPSMIFFFFANYTRPSGVTSRLVVPVCNPPWNFYCQSLVPHSLTLRSEYLCTYCASLPRLSAWFGTCVPCDVG
jgi:hypothetical protein